MISAMAGSVAWNSQSQAMIGMPCREAFRVPSTMWRTRTSRGSSARGMTIMGQPRGIFLLFAFRRRRENRPKPSQVFASKGMRPLVK